MSGGKASRGRAGGRSRRGAPLSRTTELAKKRERRSYRFRLFAFGGLLLALLLAATYMFWLRDSSLVEVKNLQVVGLDRKTEEGGQIDQAIRTAVGEMTTLHVKPEVLDQELARYPRVASARIETSLPDSATVTVSLREDGSIFGEGSDALLIATDGTVLGPAAGREDSLPLVGEGDPPVPAPGPGDSAAEGSGPEGSTLQVLTGRGLTQAVILGAAPEEFQSFVSGSHLTPRGVEVAIENGPVLLFGDSTQLDQKWRAAATLIADPDFDASSYVDLTAPRRPAVSSGETSGETPAEGSEAEPDPVVSG